MRTEYLTAAEWAAREARPVGRELLRVSAVAALLGVHRVTVSKLCKAGELERVRLSRSTRGNRITAESVDAFIARRRESAADF